MTRQAAVACGNGQTAAAAAAVLRQGGNAVDAAVAAGFAAHVSEPGLTSLGGGGFLLLRQPDGVEHLLDFFVNAPGQGLPPARLGPHFTPVTIVFSGAEQIFHAGYGSVAVPGVLDGYLTAHRRFGTLPLADVLAPARTLALTGSPIEPAQAQVLGLLKDIVGLTTEAADIYTPNRALPVVGDLLRNQPFAQFLDELIEDRATGWRNAPHVDQLIESMVANEGLVTSADLSAYAVVERSPLRLEFGSAQLTTNPPPSFGGSIVVDTLESLAREAIAPGHADRVVQRVTALQAATERAKETRSARSSTGTTHISVVDGDGRFVSMTTSNGSCSGVMAPETGVQLNNVMGEADLHPDGFHATVPGSRIGSMMAPTLVGLPDGGVVALGSGGSERIRSALLQVVLSVSTGETDLAGAIAAPRIHHDGRVLQVEPGLSPDTMSALSSAGPVNQWSGANLYFGGVHAVRRDADGGVTAVGDARRDGAGLVVDL